MCTLHSEIFATSGMRVSTRRLKSHAAGVESRSAASRAMRLEYFPNRHVKELKRLVKTQCKTGQLLPLFIFFASCFQSSNCSKHHAMVGHPSSNLPRRFENWCPKRLFTATDDHSHRDKLRTQPFRSCSKYKKDV